MSPDPDFRLAVFVIGAVLIAGMVSLASCSMVAAIEARKASEAGASDCAVRAIAHAPGPVDCQP